MVLLGFMLQLQFDILIDSQPPPPPPPPASLPHGNYQREGVGGRRSKEGRKERGKERKWREKRMQGVVCCYFVPRLFGFCFLERATVLCSLHCMVQYLPSFYCGGQNPGAEAGAGAVVL